MRNLSLVFCLLAFFFLVSACKKKNMIQYEEDPKKVKEDVNTRLTGDWLLRAYTLNGKDIIPRLNAVFANRFDVTGCVFSYWYDEADKKYISRLWSTNPQFSARKEKNFDGLTITFDQASFSQTFHSGDSACKAWFITPFIYTGLSVQTWRVTKIYDQELNLTLQNDSGEFKLFFNAAK